MSIKNIELNLRESYELEVVIDTDGLEFLAELHLSPEKIILEVYGETTKNREHIFCKKEYDKFICHTISNSYILVGARRNLGRVKVIKDISFFKKVFEIEYVICCPSSRDLKEEFFELSIYSSSIADWVGKTEKQSEILDIYEECGTININTSEFSKEIEGVGRVEVNYDVNIFTEHFNAGISFLPSLSFVFDEFQSSKEIMAFYHKIYMLFSFLIGGDLDIDRVNVKCDSNNIGTLYFPVNKGRQRISSVVLFPLSRKLKFHTNNLPELDLCIISKYFLLEGKQSSYIKEYLNYKKMNHSEDVFLGYFRILESLTYIQKPYLDEVLLADIVNKSKPYLVRKFKDSKSVSSFLKRVLRINKSKYNVEKCLQDFLCEVSEETRSGWKFSKKDIGEICKLRNDITHANDYYIDSRKLSEFVKFVEVMLILKLLSLIGIPLEKAEKVAPRIDKYYLIEVE